MKANEKLDLVLEWFYKNSSKNATITEIADEIKLDAHQVSAINDELTELKYLTIFGDSSFRITFKGIMFYENASCWPYKFKPFRRKKYNENWAIAYQASKTIALFFTGLIGLILSVMAFIESHKTEELVKVKPVEQSFKIEQNEVDSLKIDSLSAH